MTDERKAEIKSIADSVFDKDAEYVGRTGLDHVLFAKSLGLSVGESTKLKPKVLGFICAAENVGAIGVSLNKSPSLKKGVVLYLVARYVLRNNDETLFFDSCIEGRSDEDALYFVQCVYDNVVQAKNNR